MLRVYLFDKPSALSAGCAVASGSVGFKAYTDEEKAEARNGYCSQKVSVKVVGENAPAFAEAFDKGPVVLTNIAEMKVKTFTRNNGQIGTEIQITTFELPEFLEPQSKAATPAAATKAPSAAELEYQRLAAEARAGR